MFETSAVPSVSELELSRIETWVAAYQRTATLPVGVQQQCLVSGSAGTQNLVAAMKALIRSRPELLRACVEMADHMSRGPRPLLPASIVRELNPSATDGPSLDSQLQAALISLNLQQGKVSESLTRFVAVVSKVIDVVVGSPDSFVEEEGALMMTTQLFDNASEAYRCALSSEASSVASITAIAVLAITEVVTATQHSRWLAWIADLVRILFDGHDSTQAAVVAVIVSRLDDELEDSAAVCHLYSLCSEKVCAAA
jgi:hypothetical protein